MYINGLNEYNKPNEPQSHRHNRRINQTSKMKNPARTPNALKIRIYLFNFKGYFGQEIKNKPLVVLFLSLLYLCKIFFIFNNIGSEAYGSETYKFHLNMFHMLNHFFIK